MIGLHVGTGAVASWGTRFLRVRHHARCRRCGGLVDEDSYRDMAPLREFADDADDDAGPRPGTSETALQRAERVADRPDKHWSKVQEARTWPRGPGGDGGGGCRGDRCDAHRARCRRDREHRCRPRDPDRDERGRSAGRLQHRPDRAGRQGRPAAQLRRWARWSGTRRRSGDRPRRARQGRDAPGQRPDIHEGQDEGQAGQSQGPPWARQGQGLPDRCTGHDHRAGYRQAHQSAGRPRRPRRQEGPRRHHQELQDPQGHRRRCPRPRQEDQRR